MSKLESRTTKSVKNIIVALISQFAGQASSFVVRTIFIHVLSAEYLGINGLFINILQVLSLAELGVGSALIYSMYKPMASKNEAEISMYMSLYKKIYRYIGIFVLTAGLALTPFINFFISTPPDIPESLYFIYTLYVIRSASTYFFAYKQSVFQADQKAYVISKNTLIFTILKSALEIAVLVLLKNFAIYLMVAVVCMYMQNIWIAHLANKAYPYIKKSVKEKPDKKVTHDLTKNIRAMFMHKLSSILLNSSDNIILSKYVGLIEVGLYSNYALIIVIVRNCINMIFDSIVSSVGNLCASSKSEEIYKVYKTISYAGMWLVGFCTCSLLFLFNPFIELWAGKEYLITMPAIIAIVVSFYIQVNMRSIEMFRSATGLFYNDRYVSVAQCIINIVVSIILAKRYAIAGIFIGTSIAMLSTVFWAQPMLVYKHIFKQPLIKYFANYAYLTAVWLVSGFATKFILNFISLTGWAGLFVKCIICAVFLNVFFVLLTFKTQAFKNLLERALTMIKK